MGNRGKQESRSLRFFYNTPGGRLLLKAVTRPGISRLGGLYLSSRWSRRRIPKFVRKNGIDMSDYEPQVYRSFNDFFTRKIKESARPIEPEETALIAPCDGQLSAYRITDTAVLPIKNSRYSVSDLTGDPADAQRYRGGTALVFRLAVSDYHRYCYVDDGQKEDNVFLPGRLHTVRPIALRRYPVFVQNSRERTRLHTRHFGAVTQIEVGALLVGRIQNYHGAGAIRRGEEKGRFLFGGSTIVLLLEPGAAALPEALFAATEQGKEIPVRYGQSLPLSFKKASTFLKESGAKNFNLG